MTPTLNSPTAPTLLALATLFLGGTPGALSQDRISAGADGDVSLKLEIERAIADGVDFLESQQDAETGSWSDAELPAISALAISAIAGDPEVEEQGSLPDPARNGIDFLLASVKPDGGIYHDGLASYNTALSIMALLQSGDERHLPVVAEARRFLLGKQKDLGTPGETDHLLDGGIGYGDGSEAANLSTTQFTLGALYHSRKALADTEYAVDDAHTLDWEAAVTFVSRCQNSEETVRELGETVALREEDEGGFVYYPGSTKSDEIDIATDDGGKRTALRSYGSMSYAGLLSFIYANMDRDDPRIEAVMEWLRHNYTLEENPGMDAQGLYYYYHTMAKALAIAGTRRLVQPDGTEVDWKEALALEVMSRQQRDGSWINEAANRWMEDDPVLVTAYSLLALEHIHRLL